MRAAVTHSFDSRQYLYLALQVASYTLACWRDSGTLTGICALSSRISSFLTVYNNIIHCWGEDFKTRFLLPGSLGPKLLHKQLQTAHVALLKAGNCLRVNIKLRCNLVDQVHFSNPALTLSRGFGHIHAFA